MPEEETFNVDSPTTVNHHYPAPAGSGMGKALLLAGALACGLPAGALVLKLPEILLALQQASPPPAPASSIPPADIDTQFDLYVGPPRR